ncbi:AIM24 family protein, partial [Methanobrevibacter sp.]
MVICTLKEGETMKNETGAMAFMTSGMNMDTNTGGGLLKGIGRALSGDTIFLNYFTAENDNEQVGFSACTPGKIIPIELNESKTISGQKNAF